MKSFREIFESTLAEEDEGPVEIDYNDFRRNKRLRKKFKTRKAFDKWFDKNEGDIKINAWLKEAKSSDKSSFECMECGAKFKKKIGKAEIRCPKCKSVDVDLAYGQG